MKQLLKRVWFGLFVDHPLTYPGRVLMALLPATTRERYQTAFFTGNQTEGLTGRMIRAELNRRFYALGESERRRLNRERFWGGKAGVEWHENERRRLAGGEQSPEFLRYRTPVVAELKKLQAGGRYETVCEIGTGNGLFLVHLSRELPGVRRFVGIDLNPDQIARNREIYAESPLEFASVEAEVWVAANLTAPTIFVTAGTLECFTEIELRELLERIARAGVPAVVAVCEPVNIDLASTIVSVPRGNTMYSHNYPHLLQAAGFTIAATRLEPINPDIPNYQMVMMVATSAGSARPSA